MFPGSSSVGLDETVADAEGAARWVKAVANSGAQGIKLRGGTREALASVYETRKTLASVPPATMTRMGFTT